MNVVNVFLLNDPNTLMNIDIIVAVNFVYMYAHGNRSISIDFPNWLNLEELAVVGMLMHRNCYTFADFRILD